MKNFTMRWNWQMPVRFKFLVIQLLVVTAAIGVITVTMANLFHADKTTYIHDLTSEIALHTSEETGSLLNAYQEKLQVFARMMAGKDIPDKQKLTLLKQLFEDFREFVVISEYVGDAETNTVYDAKSLAASGVTKEQFTTYRHDHPLPLDKIRAGAIFIENSTISPSLPVMTIALAEPAQEGKRPNVIVAVTRLDDLISMVNRSRVFETFLVDGSGVFLAHTDLKKVTSRTKIGGELKLNTLIGTGSRSTSIEFTQNATEMVGGFARVETGNIITGVQIPKATANLSARELLQSLLLVALVLLITSALFSFFLSSRLTKPIEKLSQAAQVVGGGDFNIHVVPESRDEIGTLAESFNKMTSELKTREEALGLAQAQLVQSEKMAAFGQLGAGIAHEVKNPLAGILGYTQLSLRKVEAETPLHKNLLIIEKETKRCKEIIESLLKFARQEKYNLEAIDINHVIEDAADIVDHQLGINQVSLEKDLGQGLPHIRGNANQIQQVLMNLMINAQQAMDGAPGIVTLSSRLLDTGQIELRVRDNGPGMNEEVKARLFEPFFTTKSAGKGTGLGLSVSFGIIKEHHGEIRIESEPGAGATFIITLPVEAEKDTISSSKPVET
jgi:signal transduction histidine kinase